jgi:WD40 repeat protein
MEFAYKCFISYRRADGAGLAKWLRNKIAGYRPPNELKSRFERWGATSSSRPEIFLDTFYQKATSDFFVDWILPNLVKSEYLIVLITPSLREPLPDGSPHWVDREVAAFLDAGGSLARIIVVLGRNTTPLDIPGQLRALAPNIDWIDLRRFRRWWPFDPLKDAAVTKLISRVYNVPDEDIPVLNNEQSRRRRRQMAGLMTGITMIITSLSGLTIWAVSEGRRATLNAALAETARHLAEEERDHARAQEISAFTGQTRLLAKISSDLTELGDTEAALKAVRKVVPVFGSDSSRPYVPELEASAIHALWNRTLELEIGKLPARAAVVDERAKVAYRIEDKDLVARSLDDGAVLQKTAIGMTTPYFLRMSPKGAYILVLSTDGELVVLDLSTMATRLHVRGLDPTDPSLRPSLGFSDNDRTLLLVNNGKVRLFEITTGRLVGEYNTGTVSGSLYRDALALQSREVRVGFSTGGKYIIATYANQVDLLDPERMTVALSYKERAPRLFQLWAQTNSADDKLTVIVHLNPDMAHLATAMGALNLAAEARNTQERSLAAELLGGAKDLLEATGEPKFTVIAKSMSLPALDSLVENPLSISPRTVTFSPRGDAVAISDAESIALFDTATIRRMIPDLKSGRSSRSVAGIRFVVQDDKRLVLQITADEQFGSHAARVLELWELAGRQLRRTDRIATITSGLQWFRASPDMRRIVALSDERIKVWGRADTPRPEVLTAADRPGQSAEVHAMTVSRRAAVVATADARSDVLVLDLASNKLISKRHFPNRGIIRAIALSDDGAYAAAAANSNTIVWSIADAAKSWMLDTGRIRQIAFISPGNKLHAASEQAALLELTTTADNAESRVLLETGSCQVFVMLFRIAATACLNGKGVLTTVDWTTGAATSRTLGTHAQDSDVQYQPRLAVSGDGTALAMALPGGEVVVVDPDNFAIRFRHTATLKYNVDESIALARMSGVNTADPGLRQALEKTGGMMLPISIEGMKISENGGLMVVRGNPRSLFVNIATGGVATLNSRGAGIDDVAFSTNGQRMVVVERSDSIASVRLYNIVAAPEHRVRREFVTSRTVGRSMGSVRGIDFDRTTGQLLLADYDAGIRRLPIYEKAEDLFALVTSKVSEDLSAAEGRALGAQAVPLARLNRAQSGPPNR